jgi:hypothetical protein
MDDGKNFREIRCFRLKALIAKRRLRRDIAANSPATTESDALMGYAGRLIPTCDGPICWICKHAQPIRVPVSGTTGETDSQ